MYAVIETGGKQYRVEVGTELQVDLLDVEPGQVVTFDRVLLVGDGDATAVGQPVVADAAVQAEVVRRGRGEKLVVFKYRPKARTRVKKGHRQDHLVLRITDVTLNGRSAADESRKAGDEAQTERQRLEEAAARQAAADAELAAKLAARSSGGRPTKSAKRGPGVADESSPTGDQGAADPTGESTTPTTRRSRAGAASARPDVAAPDAASTDEDQAPDASADEQPVDAAQPDREATGTSDPQSGETDGQTEITPADATGKEDE